MLASYKFLLPSYLAVAKSLQRSKHSSKSSDVDLVRFSKLLRYVKLDNVPDLVGGCSHSELIKWFCLGVGVLPIVLLRSFSGITAQGRKSNISLFDDIPRHPSKDDNKSIHYPNFNVHAKKLLVAEVIHCTHYIADQNNQSIKKGMEGRTLLTPEFDYNSPCTNPHTLLPDFSYTFNGPVIRLPASWNREVSYILIPMFGSSLVSFRVLLNKDMASALSHSNTYLRSWIATFLFQSIYLPDLIFQ